jgi:hypothetical protein
MKMLASSIFILGGIGIGINAYLQFQVHERVVHAKNNYYDISR